MKDFCHVVVLARLTRDPEYRTFANGGGVCNFGIAYNAESRKEGESWKDVPAFVDCKAFDRGSYKLGQNLSESFKKGQRILLHGRIVMEAWDDKTTNQKRSKLVLNVEEYHFVEPKKTSDSSSGAGYSGSDDSAQYDASQSGGGEEIPF